MTSSTVMVVVVDAIQSALARYWIKIKLLAQLHVTTLVFLSLHLLTSAS